MSTIAQKLCDEIVEPVLKPSMHIHNQCIPPKKSSNRLMYQSSSKQDGKPVRSIVVEKKKVISKLVPQESNSSKTVLNKLKFKDTFLRKKLTDIAVNTLVTGPLRCDNDCVTMVRRRDNHCSCKCAHKHINVKGCPKQIQTFDTKNYSHTDKACAQCIETVSCGTQFWEKINDTIKYPDSSRSGLKVNSLRLPASIKSSMKIKQETSSNINRLSNVSNGFMGARRWALSQHPARGPDF